MYLLLLLNRINGVAKGVFDMGKKEYISQENEQLKESVSELMAIVAHNSYETQKVVAVVESTQITIFRRWISSLKRIRYNH